MKYIIPLIFCFFLSPSLTADEIKIYIWENFLSDQVINLFTQKTGHTIKQYSYDDEVDRNALLISEQASIYDLAIVDNANALSYGKMGRFHPLASLKLDNVQYNAKQWRDSCGEYGIPYAKGTMGIAYRSSIAKNKVDSWFDLLLPAKEHMGTTIMIKDDIDTLAIALLALGLDPFSASKEELKLAYSHLQKQSQYLMQYGYPLTYAAENKENSKLTLAAIYAGDIYNLKKSTGQSDWLYVVPKEGTLFYVDCFIAPSGSILKEATKQFLSFINDPEIAKKNAQEIWLSTTNEAALLMISDKYKSDSELSPNKEVLERSYYYKVVSEKELVLRNRIISTLHVPE